MIGGLTAVIELIILKKYLRFKNFLSRVIIKILVYCSVIFIGVGIISFFFQLKYAAPDYTITISSVLKTYYSKTFFTAFCWGILSSLSLNVIRELKTAFGPSIFWKKVLGIYHSPKEENRVFMFVDLVDSTRIAEEIGHLNYSRLLKNCFYIISDVALDYKASIYQFVGDEAVLTWKIKKKFGYADPLKCYFEICKKIEQSSINFKKNFSPHFRASIHTGIVAANEVGDVKKEIVYHGDVLNTTSRIQQCCTTYQKDLLVSETYFSNLSESDKKTIKAKFVGNLTLKGKTNRIKIFSVNPSTFDTAKIN